MTTAIRVIAGPEAVRGELSRGLAPAIGRSTLCTCARLEDRWSAFMVAAQEGDRDRYRALLTECGEWLDRTILAERPEYARRMLIWQILQSVHDKRQTYEPGTSFLAWLGAITAYRIAHPSKRERGVLREAREMGHCHPRSRPF